MTAHLVLVALGPVQDFIAQARRTRDLWYGSHLLSELGRAAARALIDAGASLVFPALAAGDAELAPCPAPLRQPEGVPPLNIANRLLAEVPDGVDPEAVARAVRAGVMEYWRDRMAAPVKRRCAELLADHIDAVWDEQIATFLEFAAAWAPAPSGGYAEARRAVDRALAARKHLRDFAPWQHQRGSVPKSSLDGGRETVLRRPNDRRNAGGAHSSVARLAKPHDGAARLVRKYGISRGEQLDAVGLVKRAGGEPEQFVPVVNVALACWIARAAHQLPAPLARLRDACQALGLKPVRGDLPCARDFPFDGSVLLPGRWRAVFEELGRDDDPGAWGRRNVGPLLQALGEPDPYVACVMADGDRMGRAIERIGSADAHRAFSRCLAQFASEARRIVEQEHRGSLVYAGGDDVLGFLPLPEALACADALRRRFQAAMAAACPEMAAAERPTLSIGVGIGHFMESMGELRALGQGAEALAKGAGLAVHGLDRDALAIVIDRRSGGRRVWRGRWERDPVARLQADAALLAAGLSTRKVYEIERTLGALPDPGPGDAGWAQLLAHEVRRALSRIDAGDRGVDLDAVGLPLDETAGYAAVRAEVAAWIDRLLVARAFAAAAPGEDAEAAA